MSKKDYKVKCPFCCNEINLFDDGVFLDDSFTGGISFFTCSRCNRKVRLTAVMVWQYSLDKG